jgi:adenylate cyclase class 2
MRYEVEMKFPVTDMPSLERELVGRGGSLSESVVERDVYFAHPARDFAHTDEALRIRRQGSENFLTYKGPKIDIATKTRQEIDLRLPPGDEIASSWIALLSKLGFSILGEVRKSRRKTIIAWQGRRVEGSLDEVEGLGSYVELELIAADDDLDAARECIISLARNLRLTTQERRGYLQLLLQANREPVALSSDRPPRSGTT